MKKVKVKINIGGREYPMLVNTNEEEVLRAAGKEINQRIKELEERYEVKDKQDVLAMCSLQYAAKLMGAEKTKAQESEELHQAMSGLLSEVQNSLK